MRDWLVGLAVAVGLMVTSWAVLVVLAHRLPSPTVSRPFAGCAAIHGCRAAPRSPS